MHFLVLCCLGLPDTVGHFQGDPGHSTVCADLSARTHGELVGIPGDDDWCVDGRLSGLQAQPSHPGTSELDEYHVVELASDFFGKSWALGNRDWAFIQGCAVLGLDKVGAMRHVLDALVFIDVLDQFQLGVFALARTE